MRRRIVSLLSDAGSLVNCYGLSAAAERAGLTTDAIIGTKCWGWNQTASERLLREKHAQVMHDDVATDFAVSSEIGGVTEHWTIHMEPVLSPVRVLCVGTQTFNEKTPSLTRSQMDLLRMLADDWQYQQMADRVGCTLPQMHQRLLTLRKRFNVRTNHGLVAAAGRHGLLT